MNANSLTIDVLLGTLIDSADAISDVQQLRDSFDNYGIMSSSVYREQLYSIFTDKAVPSNAQFFIFVLAAAIKNKDRILNSIDKMPAEIKNKDYFKKAKTFYQNQTVQYTSQHSFQNKKFSVVHIPSCNPSMDMLAWCLITKDEKRTVENFFARTTAVQLDLDTALQNRAKEAYRVFWTVTVTGTKKEGSSNEEARTESRENWQRYYETSAGDTYPLVTKEMTFVLKSGANSKYNMQDITNYLRSFDAV